MARSAKRRRRGLSYQKRVADINRIYEEKSQLGLSNREIWQRFVYPQWGVCERAFYGILKASVDPKNDIPQDEMSLFSDEDYEK